MERALSGDIRGAFSDMLRDVLSNSLANIGAQLFKAMNPQEGKGGAGGGFSLANIGAVISSALGRFSPAASGNPTPAVAAIASKTGPWSAPAPAAAPAVDLSGIGSTLKGIFSGLSQPAPQPDQAPAPKVDLGASLQGLFGRLKIEIPSPAPMLAATAKAVAPQMIAGPAASAKNLQPMAFAVQVEASPYFDTQVRNVAAPMVARGEANAVSKSVNLTRRGAAGMQQRMARLGTT